MSKIVIHSSPFNCTRSDINLLVFSITKGHYNHAWHAQHCRANLLELGPLRNSRSSCSRKVPFTFFTTNTGFLKWINQPLAFCISSNSLCVSIHSSRTVPAYVAQQLTPCPRSHADYGLHSSTYSNNWSVGWPCVEHPLFSVGTPLMPQFILAHHLITLRLSTTWLVIWFLL